MLSPLRFGRVEVRPVERQLLIDGRAAVLGARALDVLLALIEHRDRVVSKNELLDLVWPGLVVEENNLQVQVSSLRKLLGPQAISTIPGRGYRFAAALDELSAAPADAAATTQSEPPKTAPGNLPGQLTPLIGRDTELRELQKQIEASRLVTIVGAGGMGKTTLGLAVARVLQRQFKDGVWLIQLTAVSDPLLVAQTMAHTLRITLSNPSNAQQRLIDVLAQQNMLVVLDNGEHLADAVGRVALALTTHAPGVHVLTTSQKLLNIAGETVFKMGPLALPSVDEVKDIERFGAVGLFAERARAVQRDFAITALNSDAVAEICRRLDGMPLAIELAAARVRLLGVTGVRDRLAERFKLLTGGAHDVTGRHQALHTTIDWSYSLLHDNERTVLRRLAVFVGGFGLELAQRVAADDGSESWKVLDALSALVDSSLVQVEGGDPPRYRLLESTRAYALEQLTKANEADTFLRRHANAVRDLFVQTEEARFGENGTLTMSEFVHALSPEVDNLRAAFDWAVQHDDVETAIALASASIWLFRWLGLSHEALERLLSLRARVGELPESYSQVLVDRALAYVGYGGAMRATELLEVANRAVAALRGAGRRRLYQSLYHLGFALAALDRVDEVRSVVEQMSQIERATDPPWLRAMRMNLAGAIHLRKHQFAEAVAVHAEQRQLLTGAHGEEVSLMICESNLCAALNCLGRFEEASAVAQSTIECAERLHLTSAYPTWQLLHAQLSLGQLEEAELAVRRAMADWRRDAMLLVVAGDLGMLLAKQGRMADAARVDAAASAYVQRSGAHPHPVRTIARRRTLDLLAAANLDPKDVARWQREGETLDENAIATLCLS